MRLALGLMLCCVASYAAAQLAGTGSNSGAPFRPLDWGMGLGGGSGVAPPPPVDPCTGAIDMSEGCALTIAIGLGP